MGKTSYGRSVSDWRALLSYHHRFRYSDPLYVVCMSCSSSPLLASSHALSPFHLIHTPTSPHYSVSIALSARCIQNKLDQVGLDRNNPFSTLNNKCLNRNTLSPFPLPLPSTTNLPFHVAPFFFYPLGSIEGNSLGKVVERTEGEVPNN